MSRIGLALAALYGVWIAAWALYARVLPGADGARDFSYWLIAKLVVWIALMSVLLRGRPRDFAVVVSGRAVGVGIALGAIWIGATLAIIAAGWRPPPRVTTGWPLVNALIVAPLLEELLFRGLLWTRLREAGTGPVATCVIAAIAFVLLHVPGWYVGPMSAAAMAQSGAMVALAGIFFGVGRLAGQSVVTAVILHVANNLANSGLL